MSCRQCNSWDGYRQRMEKGLGESAEINGSAGSFAHEGSHFLPAALALQASPGIRAQNHPSGN